jgi:hypothetical protein
VSFARIFHLIESSLPPPAVQADFEKSYWKGILDAQGKTDGGYY